MADDLTQTRPPVVLIIDDQEWSTRSLESVLAPNGYAVMRAYTGRNGIDRARTHRPDVVIIDSNLPDGEGLEVCRALRSDPQFSACAPILITSPERPSRQERLEILRAGAWDVVAYPVDTQELMLKLSAYVRAKFEADRLRNDSLIDAITGLYNLHGLERRAQELGSQAFRAREALACVVVAPMLPDTEGDDGANAAVQRLAKAFKAAGRGSDAIGRLGKTEFAIIAPNTDSVGAVRLAERLAEAIRTVQAEARDAGDHPFELRAGYDAVTDARESPAAARDVLMRATIALRKSKTNGQEGDWIRPFEARAGLS
jgi:diguanylate cyclase (GGDEF)-like protein